VEINPAKSNGTGKQKKTNGEYPSECGIDPMIPEDVNQQPKKSERAKRMSTRKAKAVYSFDQWIKRSMTVENCLEGKQDDGTDYPHGRYVE
jgi:hypothetical protein